MFRTPGLVSQMSSSPSSLAHSHRLYTIMRDPQGVQTPHQISDSVRNRLSLIDMLGERDQLPQYSDSSFPCEAADEPEIDEQGSNFEDILVSYEQSQRRAHVGEACAQVIDCLTECINRIREIQQGTANEDEGNQISLGTFHQSYTRGCNCQEGIGRQLPYVHVESMVLTNQYLYETLQEVSYRPLIRMYMGKMRRDT